ncbi:MAG: tetratricopeptide repeat protein [bacterium]
MDDLAAIHEVRLGRPDHAWPWRARALEAAPTDASRLAAAVRTAESAGTEADLADRLTRLLDEVEPGETLALRRAFARLCAEALGRPEDAARAYEAIQAEVGDEPATITALEDLYRRLEDWDALASTYARRLEAAATVEEKCAILAAVGELQENVRDDQGAARAAYEQIRALDPRNLEALRGLQRLARQDDDAEALAGLLEAELSLARDAESRASIRARLARLADEAGDAEEALVHLGQALEAVPGHREAVAHLTAMLDGAAGPQAAAVLEPELRRAEDWAGLRRVLALQVEGSPEPADRARLLREVAELEERRLDDPAAAFATWQRVLVQSSADAGVRGELERLAEGLGAFAELAEHYARFAVGGAFAADDPDGALVYSRLLAGIQEQRLGQPAAARATLEALAVEQGDDEATLDALDRLATRLQDWRGLVDIGERRLALQDDPDARRELFVRIGDLWEEVLQQPEQAAGVYRRLLAEHPDERAFRALDRILRRLQRWGDLADLQRSRLLDLTGEPARALAMELAELLKDELSNPHEAIEVLAAVLEEDPADEGAADALQLMLIEHDGPADRPLRQRLCEVLQPVYEARGDWQSSISVLQARLDDEEGPLERAALGVQIAELYEGRARDKRAAFASYGQAFGETWSDPDILAALERLAAELEAFGDLAWHLRRGVEAEGGAEGHHRVDLLRRVATLYEDRVGDLDQAVDFNRRLLAEEPDDQEALARLDGLYQRTGDLASLAAVIEQRAQHADDRDALLTQLFRLGALLEEQLDDSARAIEVYRQIRGEVEPGDARAHGALERLLAAAGEWEALVEVLVDHAEMTEELPTKRGLLRRAAEALESGLDRPAQAADLYRQLVALDEKDTEALRELDRLLVRLEQPIELLEVLEAQGIWRRVGPAPTWSCASVDWCTMPSASRGGRSRPTVRPSRCGPVMPPPQAALRSCWRSPEVRLEAGALLAELHAAADRAGPLRDVLRRTLDDREEVADQVATLERIARLEETSLDDPGAAFAALAEAWRRDEAGERLEPELLRLAEKAGRVPALVDLYVELAPLAERAEALRLEAARLAEVRLGDLERAAEQLQEVLRLDPENAAALSGLERLLARTGDARGLAEVLDRKVELADSDAERKALLVQLADLQESLLDDPTAAIDTWRRVLADDEEDAGALDALERLLGAQGRWPEVAALLDHRVGIEKAPAAAELRLAGVLERHLGEGERALELYRAVLEADPASQAARAARWRRCSTIPIARPRSAWSAGPSRWSWSRRSGRRATRPSWSACWTCCRRAGSTIPMSRRRAWPRSPTCARPPWGSPRRRSRRAGGCCAWPPRTPTTAPSSSGWRAPPGGSTASRRCWKMWPRSCSIRASASSSCWSSGASRSTTAARMAAPSRSIATRWRSIPSARPPWTPWSSCSAAARASTSWSACTWIAPRSRPIPRLRRSSTSRRVSSSKR